MAKIQCSFGWEMKKWGDKKIEREDGKVKG